jgi:hypothetical protein
MAPKRKDILTEEEERLIDVAARIDAAIRYRERALAKGDPIDDDWYEEGLGSELVSVLYQSETCRINNNSLRKRYRNYSLSMSV